jgi:hypothetical protein
LTHACGERWIEELCAKQAKEEGPEISSLPAKKQKMAGKLICGNESAGQGADNNN